MKQIIFILIVLCRLLAQGQITTNNLWYADADRDGMGNPLTTMIAAQKPEGYVSNSDDFNDSDASCYPGAPDICDGKDNNADGQTDEEPFIPELFPSNQVILQDGISMPVYCTGTGEGFTYIWYRDGRIIDSAKDSYIEVSEAGKYQVMVQTPGGCFALTKALVVVVPGNNYLEDNGMAKTF